MRRFFILLISGIIALIVTGCASSKEILYFQDIDQSSPEKITSNYEAKIQPADILSIIVSGPDKTVISPYNLTLGGGSSESSNLDFNGITTSNPENSVLKYTVSPDGYISFPVLGKIKVSGMTRSELANYLKERIKDNVNNPIVYVKITNYKVTILGEVKNPGSYSVNSQRITILEALGYAGDLLITAQRDNIILIREINGKQEHFMIDLKDSSLLNSPYFYLRQNDILYVPQSPTRVAQGTLATSAWRIVLSSITTLVTVVAFIITASK